jgi:excisionase family DNA binding protein
MGDTQLNEAHHVILARALTVDEVADYLRVSRSTIYRLLRRNQLPAFKIGND